MFCLWFLAMLEGKIIEATFFKAQSGKMTVWILMKNIHLWFLQSFFFVLSSKHKMQVNKHPQDQKVSRLPGHPAGLIGGAE